MAQANSYMHTVARQVISVLIIFKFHTFRNHLQLHECLLTE